MAKTQHPTPHRRKAAFIISTTLIGLLFIATLLSVLSGKFRPFASLVNQPPVTPTPAVLDDSNSTVISGSKLTYKNPQNDELSVGGNDVVLGRPERIIATLPLQGLGAHHDTAATLTGDVTILRDGGDITNPADVVAKKLTWQSVKSVEGNTKLEITFDTPALAAKIAQTNIAPPYEIRVKAKNYLAVTLTGVTDLGKVLAFPEAPVGDLFDSGDDYNIVTDRDFSVFTASQGKPDVAKDPADFNHDGKIDQADLSLLIGNLGRKGDAL